MNKPYGKRLELHYTREDGTQLHAARIVDNTMIEMSAGDILGWEKDSLKREFGLALVEFLGIEVTEEDYTYPRYGENE